MNVLSVVLWILSAIGTVTGECAIAGGRIGGTRSLGKSITVTYPPGKPNEPCVSHCKHQNAKATSKGNDDYRCTKWTRVTNLLNTTLVNCASYRYAGNIRILAKGRYSAGVLGPCNKMENNRIDMATPNCFERKKYNPSHITYLKRIVKIKALEPPVPMTCQKMCKDHAKANPNNGCTHVNYFAYFESTTVAINAHCVYFKIKDPNAPLPANASTAVGADDEDPNEWSGPVRCPRQQKFTKYVTFKV